MESHLLQMRGLKLISSHNSILVEVASFTDAWIETYRNICTLNRSPVASFTDAWIETFNPEFDHIGYRRIFYRCVD